MTTQCPLYISSVGLSDHDLFALHAAIKLLSKSGEIFRVINGDSCGAHLLVLDDENESGRAALEGSRKGQVKLALASSPRSGKNIVAVKKPVEVSTLKVLLSKLYGKMQAQFNNASAVRNQVSPAPVAPDIATAEANQETLFHRLLEAKEDKQVLCISCPSHPDIFVDGANRSLATVANMDSVREIIRTPITELVIEKMDSTDFAANNNGLSISSLHYILWVTGIECSKGCLLPGHSVDELVKLRAWPNFTRSDFRPEHLKLSAVLARHPVSLSDLGKMTQVPMQDIINFYNAACAVDLIDRGVSAQESSVQRPTLNRQKKSLFNRIAQRLKLVKFA